VRVPQDFDFEWAVRDCFFPNERPSHEPGGVDLARVLARQGGTEPGRGRFLRTGRNLKAGERVMAFDILTGDQLFVDRMSYHFIPPAVGSGFVFRTGNIEGLARSYGDQYYIKRLVGVPGDTLEIKGFALQRNGAPITGAAVFAGNARQEGNHVGYRYEGLLRPGTQVKVGAGEYFALGDNSANSLDGRYWGTVPARDVVGRPILVYFPFTRHWGPAQ
jgi:signal peptidase I